MVAILTGYSLRADELFCFYRCAPASPEKAGD
jgi:hypothetical protein